MKTIFYIAGSVIIVLAAGLSLLGIYLIEKHQTDLNKARTEKARQTRIDNLDAKKQEPSETLVKANGILDDLKSTKSIPVNNDDNDEAETEQKP